MSSGPHVYQVAETVQHSIGLVLRRLRQVKIEGELTMPASSALARLSREGPATSAELARAEQVSPQSMGTTLAALESAGLIERGSDATDRRRVVLSATEAGLARYHHKRSARTEQLAAALSSGFAPDELRLLHDAAPLLERLARNL